MSLYIKRCLLKEEFVFILFSCYFHVFMLEQAGNIKYEIFIILHFASFSSCWVWSVAGFFRKRMSVNIKA